jgi:uncharacterized protein (DUF1501 family)
MNPNYSRRSLLRILSGAASAFTVNSLGGMSAFAQSAPDYKALVCVFLFGGNDSHNMLIPQETDHYASYRAIRRGLALPDGNTQILPIAARSGVPFAFNRGLAAIHPLWATGQLACVANVGMLAAPTSRGAYLARSVPLPTNLFSHADQVIQKQAGDPNGSGGSGWIGRIADLSNGLNGTSRFPAAVSMSGSALMTIGNIIQAASLNPGFDLSANGLGAWPASAQAARSQALQEILAFDNGLTLVQAANRVRSDAVELNRLLRSTGTAAPLATAFPGTNLGRQMQQVANIIRLRGASGMGRQVFFCSLGGFDTHSSQSWNQWDLLRQVGEAMRALYDATVEMGVSNQVTTFTETDFGRTLEPSGSGSDHGWGGHQLVLGGAVRGGDVYGRFPTLALAGPDDAGTRGVLIPTTSLDQYGATFARWFGVSESNIPQVFPNIGRFATSNLGFMA